MRRPLAGFCSAVDNNSGNFTIYVYNGQIFMYLEEDSNRHEIVGGTVTADQWHHLAFSFGSDGMKLYLDGTQVGSDNYTGGIGNANQNPIILGASSYNSDPGSANHLDHHLDGQLAEVSLHDTQLSTAEIQAFIDAGTDGSDATTGTAGNDTLSGNGSHDIVFGGAGADTLDGGGGGNVLYGGDGNDSLDNSIDPTGENTFFGGAGNDTLRTGSGNDTLFGGSGDDRLSGEAAADTLWGETGNDWISGGTGNDTLSGGEGSDSLYGGSNDDTLLGDADSDSLFGGDGADKLYGGAGADTLSGGSDGDTLFGGTGSDTMNGGAADDSAWGGDGSDLFIFQEAGGADFVSGGAAGGWTDTLELQDAAGGTPTSGWTYNLTTGAVSETGADYLVLSDDAAGSITLADGSEVTFEGIERIEW